MCSNECMFLDEFIYTSIFIVLYFCIFIYIDYDLICLYYLSTACRCHVIVIFIACQYYLVVKYNYFASS